jgi:hypothetical protein
MSIVGVLWLIFIVLKFCAVIHASWWLVILWPLISAVIFIILGLFGMVALGGRKY